MKRIFITGVSGYIGMKITRALAEHSRVEQIVGIDIRPPAQTPEKLLFVEQDVRAPLLDLLNEHAIDTVIHAAYVLPPMHNTALMEDINVAGTRNVLNAAAAAGVAQLLYTSSTTAYGFYPDNPMPLIEGSPLRGNDDFTYTKNKKEIELILAAFETAHPDMALTILRPCFVAGPGFDNPLSRYLKKPIVPLPPETAPFQFVHEDDLVRVMVICLEKRLTGRYNVAAEGTIEFPEMVALLGNRVLRLPLRLMIAGNSLFWFLRLGFLTEFPSSGFNLILHPWLASSKRLIEKTGFEFQYTSRAAFEDFANSAKAR